MAAVRCLQSQRTSDAARGWSSPLRCVEDAGRGSRGGGEHRLDHVTDVKKSRVCFRSPGSTSPGTPRRRASKSRTARSACVRPPRARTLALAVDRSAGRREDNPGTPGACRLEHADRADEVDVRVEREPLHGGTDVRMRREIKTTSGRSRRRAPRALRRGCRARAARLRRATFWRRQVTGSSSAPAG